MLSVREKWNEHFGSFCILSLILYLYSNKVGSFATPMKTGEYFATAKGFHKMLQPMIVRVQIQLRGCEHIWHSERGRLFTRSFVTGFNSQLMVLSTFCYWTWIVVNHLMLPIYHQWLPLFSTLVVHRLTSGIQRCLLCPQTFMGTSKYMEDFPAKHLWLQRLTPDDLVKISTSISR